MEQILLQCEQVALNAKKTLLEKLQQGPHFWSINVRQESGAAGEGELPLANFGRQLSDCWNATAFHGAFISSHISGCSQQGQKL